MPELVEQMYCSQQIVIPPKFPYILKRYCKAAIKTQPYDLLRWSHEYFKALAERRPPPVKLRLEFPVFSTEGGLTRGCLKVLANQLSSMTAIPLPVLKQAWGGFCLDSYELTRILCLCEVHMRQDAVPFLHFIAVAGGLLTKCLTHTMILLCESLTKEPDGGSAAISVHDFLAMYKFLARIDASKDVRYFNGYRENEVPPVVEEEEKVEAESEHVESEQDTSSDDFWHDNADLQRLSVINAKVTRSSRLSAKLNMPTVGNIERSASVERAMDADRDISLGERKGRAVPNEEVDKKLRAISNVMMSTANVQETDLIKEKAKEEKIFEDKTEGIEIVVQDEDGKEIPNTFYGEPPELSDDEEMSQEDVLPSTIIGEEEHNDEEVKQSFNVDEYVAECHAVRQERLADLEMTMNEIKHLVDKYDTANYDLGMVAGRQMSLTSAEFIAQHIEKEIMADVDEQIEILPDPELKKKKAKPEEVEMVKQILEDFLEENMDVIVPETEEAEEEEREIPEIMIVYAVPGIGPPVGIDIVTDVYEYALDISKTQGDVFMPRNIRHFLCPPLEKYRELKYEISPNPSISASPMKEEVPTGGIITD